MHFRFSVSLIYFALSLNAGTLSGDLFVNTFLLGVIEFPVLLLNYLILQKGIIGLCNIALKPWMTGMDEHMVIKPCVGRIHPTKWSQILTRMIFGGPCHPWSQGEIENALQFLLDGKELEMKICKFFNFLKNVFLLNMFEMAPRKLSFLPGGGHLSVIAGRNFFLAAHFHEINKIWPPPLGAEKYFVPSPLGRRCSPVLYYE